MLAEWRLRPWSMLALTLTIAVFSAVLLGALLAGSSVQATVREHHAQRLGHLRTVVGGAAMFAEDLAQRSALGLAPVLAMPGSVAVGGHQQVPGVRIYGVDDRFWRLAPRPVAWTGTGVALGQALAQRLQVALGETLILRVAKPSWLPRDALMAETDAVGALRLPLQQVLDDDQLGAFSLANDLEPALNVFVDLASLQRQLDQLGNVNLLLSDQPSRVVQTALESQWRLADVGLELRTLAEGGCELQSKAIFIDPVVQARAPEGQAIYTYLVNRFAVAGRESPYAFVSGLSPALLGRSGTPGMPQQLDDDALVVGSWLAQDLGITPGDVLDLTYYVLGPARRLVEATASLRVAAVVPLQGLAADAQLMPSYPGLAEADDCRHWDAAIPIDMARIRPQDEAYWDEHRGTPKAFVSLATARRLWAGDVGNCTALRFEDHDPELVRARVRAALTAAELGLQAQDVVALARAASQQGLDFPLLFVSLGSFLLVAALVLMALVFALAADERQGEAALLAICGWTRGALVRRLAVRLGQTLVLGLLIGLPLGLALTQGLLATLRGPWSGILGSAQVSLQVEPWPFILTAILTLVLGVVVAAGRLRAVVGRDAAQQLGRNTRGPRAASSSRAPALVAGVLLLLALTLSVLTPPEPTQVLRFFTVAVVLLGGLLALVLALLRARVRPSQRPQLGLCSWALAQLARRPGRALVLVITLACSSFLVVCMGAFVRDAGFAAQERHSGTGGFTWVASLAVPYVGDFNDPAQRAALGVNETRLQGCRALALRSNGGDDAGCFNLGRAQNPRVWGLSSQDCVGRFSFVSESEPGLGWAALDQVAADGVIPVIADQNVALWALGLQLGSTSALRDSRGQLQTVRVVGLVRDSLLQGGLLMAEAAHRRLWPEQGGAALLLVEAPAGQEAAVGEELRFIFADHGLALESARERLQRFLNLQNVYLGMFQVLGGLGLVLGSVGLAAIALYQVRQRRGELAIAYAVGFSRRRLSLGLALEHSFLLLTGLGVGALAAQLALVPVRRIHDDLGHQGLHWWLLLLAAVLGVAVVVLAVRLALRGPLVACLRRE